MDEEEEEEEKPAKRETRTRSKTRNEEEKDKEKQEELPVKICLRGLLRKDSHASQISKIVGLFAASGGTRNVW